MNDYLLNQPLDYELHNLEVKQVWDAYHIGKPFRAPIQYSMNPRMILQNKELNTWGYNWHDYFDDPDVRWTVELTFQKWVRFNVLQDSEMGPPEKEWPGITVNYQNCDEAAWFGCPFYFPSDDMPFILPVLKENKLKLYEMEPPNPLRGGIMSRAMEHYEYLEEKRQHVDYDGKPVGKSSVFGAGTDGPFTVACNLRGANEIAQDLYQDPSYIHALLSFITDAIIARIKKIISFNGGKYPTPGWFFADDSIEMMSLAMYKDFVLPYHRRLLQEFSVGGPNGIHLCGRVQRYLKYLMQELNITTFDLGFPTDMGQARRDLGDGVTLIGNIAPHLLKSGPVEDIRIAVHNLCLSGAMKGGHFILHDGNNCAPGTPVRHFQAMYEAGKEYGRYCG